MTRPLHSPLSPLPPPLHCHFPPSPLFVSGAPAFSPPQLYSESVGGREGGREGAWRNRGSREHELQHHFRVSVRGGRAGGRGPPTASRPRPAGVSRAFRACECVGLSRAESACPRAPPRALPPPFAPCWSSRPTRLPPFPANAAPPALWLRLWRRRSRRRRVSLAPLQLARAKLSAPPPSPFPWGGVEGGVHGVTVCVSVPEPEVVVEERAMGRNGGA